jgi:hypothetical protein
MLLTLDERFVVKGRGRLKIIALLEDVAWVQSIILNKMRGVIHNLHRAPKYY